MQQSVYRRDDKKIVRDPDCKLRQDAHRKKPLCLKQLADRIYGAGPTKPGCDVLVRPSPPA